MKKFVLFSLATLTLASCTKNEPDPTPEKYITDDLVVTEDQKAFLIETTGTWCQYCPNGAALMLKEMRKYNVNGDSNIRVIGFASHTGDPLETPVQTLLNATFPTSGVPNFYVNNADASQSISGPTAAALSGIPVVGVAHVTHENATGDTVVVDVKVQFFEDSKNTSYYVQSYLLATGIEAREYTVNGMPVNLNQVSSVPIVTTGSGATPSTWAVDTVGKKSGDIYTHDHIPVVQGVTDFQWGVTLDTVNPLGRSYFKGDIFGSKYTPIQIKLPKMLPTVPGVEYEVVTIIWSERYDGTAGVLFVNGYEGL